MTGKSPASERQIKPQGLLAFTAFHLQCTGTPINFLIELIAANRAKPPADAELCLLYIAQRFIFKRTII